VRHSAGLTLVCQFLKFWIRSASFALVAVALSSCTPRVFGKRGLAALVPLRVASSLGWQQSSPSNAGTFNAEWTPPGHSSVSSQGFQLFTGASCDTPLGTEVSLPALTTSSHAFIPTAEIAYSFQIISYLNDGSTLSSDCSKPIVSDVTPPQEVTVLGWVQSSPTSATSLTASWTLPFGALSKSISVFMNGSCTGSPAVSNIPAGATTHSGIIGSNGSSISFQVTTRDEAGNTALSACSSGISIDTDPPVLTLAAGNVVHPGSVAAYPVSGNCTGMATGATVTFRHGTTPVGSATCGGAGTYSGVVNLSAVPNGPVVLSVSGLDAAGNTGSASQTFTNAAGITITSFDNSPGGAVAARGGTVKVMGSNFYGVSSVKIGTTVVSSFTVLNSGRIDLVVPLDAVTGAVSLLSATDTLITSSANLDVDDPAVLSIGSTTEVVLTRGTRQTRSVTLSHVSGVAATQLSLSFTDTDVTGSWSAGGASTCVQAGSLGNGNCNVSLTITPSQAIAVKAQAVVSYWNGVSTVNVTGDVPFVGVDLEVHSQGAIEFSEVRIKRSAYRILRLRNPGAQAIDLDVQINRLPTSPEDATFYLPGGFPGGGLIFTADPDCSTVTGTRARILANRTCDLLIEMRTNTTGPATPTDVSSKLNLTVLDSQSLAAVYKRTVTLNGRVIPERTCDCNAGGTFSGGGNGLSPATAYGVCTLNDLKNVKNHLSSHFIQCADIDLASGTPAHWVPIDGAFTGSYDGDHYRLYSLTADPSPVSSAGLFSHIQNGTVKNLILSGTILTNPGTAKMGAVSAMTSGASSGANLTGILVIGNIQGGAGSQVGGLVGTASEILSVSKSQFHGDVGGPSVISVGGLVGDATVGNAGAKSFNDNLVYATLTGNQSVGGLVGKIAETSTFESNVGSGTVTAVTHAGGMAGTVTAGTFTLSAYFGEVLSQDPAGDAGGVAGYAAESTIQHSSSSGRVSSWGKAGGITGYHVGGTLDHVYSTAAIIGQKEAGGLVGHYVPGNTRGFYDSYFAGTVDGSQSGNYGVGGIVGWLEGDSISPAPIERVMSYSRSVITQSSSSETDYGLFLGAVSISKIQIADGIVWTVGKIRGHPTSGGDPISNNQSPSGLTVVTGEDLLRAEYMNEIFPYYDPNGHWRTDPGSGLPVLLNTPINEL
jgi:hypothetical protein